MSPQMVREEQLAARDERPAAAPQSGTYRPWDEAGRPERHEAAEASR